MGVVQQRTLNVCSGEIKTYSTSTDKLRLSKLFQVEEALKFSNVLCQSSPLLVIFTGMIGAKASTRTPYRYIHPHRRYTL